jgi:transcriptional regulator with XRE-family HTH domain
VSINHVFAENLRSIRIASNLTQEELAFRAGLNRNYIGMIERLERSPTLEVAYKIALALNVNLSDMLNIKKDEPST